MGSRLTTRAFWKTYVSDVVSTTEAQSEAYLASTPRAEVVRRSVVVIGASAISLWFINFARRGAGWLVPHNPQFAELVRWAIVSIAGYVVLPVIAVKVLLKEKLRDFGLKVRGSLGSWRVYASLYALSIPFIVLVSTRSDFQMTYPFYDLAPGEAWWPYLWAWWLLYAAQFVALEFFFRGFMVHGLKLRLGIASVFVMVVPYLMIHFVKPPLEALSAIFGGTVLGFLSLKTGSVWWGAGLHIAIAATMDLLALARQGLL